MAKTRKTPMPKLPRVVVTPLQMGEYQPVPGKPGIIFMDPHLSEKDHLDTVLHESIHACAPFIEEEYVEEIAVFLGRMLRRAGYTRQPRKTK